MDEMVDCFADRYTANAEMFSEVSFGIKNVALFEFTRQDCLFKHQAKPMVERAGALDVYPPSWKHGRKPVTHSIAFRCPKRDTARATAPLSASPSGVTNNL
ncbi:hypothetical protein GCM10007919_28870 [Rhizobium indigoferae]|nr:hypothetical protein GCM10007919_28870 [Rhizobium indigoferae]